MYDSFLTYPDKAPMHNASDLGRIKNPPLQSKCTINIYTSAQKGRRWSSSGGFAIQLQDQK
jgi:hypothetical protein